MSKLKVAALLAGVVTFAAFAPHARAEGSVDITFTTSPTSNPRYYPRNILAVWIEDGNGHFVRTLMRYANRRVRDLIAWNSIAQDKSFIDGMPDVITGATRSSHGTYTVHWDLTDYNGNAVPSGTYTIRMELTDHDTNTTTGNNEGSFTVQHSGQSADQNGLSSGGFTNVSVSYTAAPSGGGGGDPGTPGDCSTVTLCVDDDGCCSPDCVYEVDNDCDPATARDDQLGGCRVGGRSGGGIALLLIGLFALRARRRSH